MLELLSHFTDEESEVQRCYFTHPQLPVRKSQSSRSHISKRGSSDHCAKRVPYANLPGLGFLLAQGIYWRTRLYKILRNYDEIKGLVSGTKDFAVASQTTQHRRMCMKSGWDVTIYEREKYSLRAPSFYPPGGKLCFESMLPSYASFILYTLCCQLLNFWIWLFIVSRFCLLATPPPQLLPS